METELKGLLRPACRRWRLQAALGFMMVGATFGAVLSIIAQVVLVCWFAPSDSLAAVTKVVELLPIIILPIAAFLVVHRVSDDAWFMFVAGLIDWRYDLQDRTVTALAIVESGRTDAVRAFQVEDALKRLSQVDPRKVAPFRMPSGWMRAAILVVVAVVLAALTAGKDSSTHRPTAEIPAKTTDSSRDRAGVEPGQAPPNFSPPDQRIVDRYFQLLETQQERAARPASAD